MRERWVVSKQLEWPGICSPTVRAASIFFWTLQRKIATVSHMDFVYLFFHFSFLWSSYFLSESIVFTVLAVLWKCWYLQLCLYLMYILWCFVFLLILWHFQDQPYQIYHICSADIVRSHIVCYPVTHPTYIFAMARYVSVQQLTALCCMKWCTTVMQWDNDIDHFQ